MDYARYSRAVRVQAVWDVEALREQWDKGKVKTEQITREQWDMIRQHDEVLEADDGDE